MISIKLSLLGQSWLSFILEEAVNDAGDNNKSAFLQQEDFGLCNDDDWKLMIEVSSKN